VTPAARTLLLTLVETGVGSMEIDARDVPAAAELLAVRLIELYDSEGRIKAHLPHSHAKPEPRLAPLCERIRQQWTV
jgi:hypothetical protein